MRQAGRSKTVVIALDSAELSLIERHVAMGALPHLARLLGAGTSGELRTPELPEHAWAEILTGCTAATIGYGTPLAIERDYRVRMIEAYDFAAFRPFYAYGAGRRAIVFDVPQTRLADRVEGVQILGWGSHSTLAPSASNPPELLARLRAEFGPHPAFAEDWMTVPETLLKSRRLTEAYLTGIARREALCLALMARQDWDLLVVAFGEPHGAGHALWHLSRTDHPIEALYRRPDEDAMLAIHRAVDHAIGAIVAAAGPASRILLFSSNGMKANAMELGTLVFLPELLYRSAFARKALDFGNEIRPLPPRRQAPSGDWGQLLWAMQSDRNALRRAVRRRAGLALGRRLERLLGGAPALEHPFTSRLHYMPPMWYRRCWPRMPAFALPSFADGAVRFNLQGRERQGMVDPADAPALTERLARLLLPLRDARTGAKVVDEIITPSSGADSGGPDLVVRWSPHPSDAVVSDALGRIGPLPFRQAGGHRPRGFFAASGPGIPARSLPPGRLVDIAPAVLALLGAPPPNHFEGRAEALLGDAFSVAAV